MVVAEVEAVLLVDTVDIQHTVFLLQAHQVINNLGHHNHNKLNNLKADIQVAVDGINLHRHQQRPVKVITIILVLMIHTTIKCP